MMVDEESDAAAIEASIAEPNRFAVVFDRHAAVLFRYLVRRVGPDEADGMLGELFRIAFERRDSFDVSRASARPWLYGIATNLVAKHRRGEARRLRATARLLAGESPQDDVAGSVAAMVDAGSQWPLVADAIAALRPAERDALVLVVWEGLSYEDVAGALGVPIGTVRSRLNRARRRIRELVSGSGK